MTDKNSYRMVFDYYKFAERYVHLLPTRFKMSSIFERWSLFRSLRIKATAQIPRDDPGEERVSLR